MTLFGFPRRRRIISDKEFAGVLKNGAKISHQGIVLWHCRASSPDGESRLGIIVSKKTGGAVVRNRLKRFIREVFRLNRQDIARGTDLILYPVRADRLNNYAEVAETVFKLWRKAGLIAENRQPGGSGII